MASAPQCNIADQLPEGSSKYPVCAKLADPVMAKLSWEIAELMRQGTQFDELSKLLQQERERSAKMEKDYEAMLAAMRKEMEDLKEKHQALIDETNLRISNLQHSLDSEITQNIEHVDHIDSLAESIKKLVDDNKSKEQQIIDWREKYDALLNDEFIILVRDMLKEWHAYLDQRGVSYVEELIGLGKEDKHGSWKLKLLLLKRPDIVRMVGDDDYTPLHYAARDNNIEAMKMLIQYGASLDDETNIGNTALHLAVWKESNECMMYLLKNHPILLNMKNIGGFTPLHVAANHGLSLPVQFLLKHGADVHAKDINGLTALQDAQEEGHYEVAMALRNWEFEHEELL